MSYGMMSYMIDTDFLASLWHCDDPQRLERIYQVTKESLHQRESELELRSGAMYMALRSIIKGDIPAKHFTERRVTYAYVVEAICGAYGTKLANHTMSPCWLDAFQPFPTLYNLSLNMEELPFHIPIADDFPMVGCIPNADVAAKLAEHDQIDTSDLASDLQAIGAQYRSWLEKAQQHGQGIVTLYY